MRRKVLKVIIDSRKGYKKIHYVTYPPIIYARLSVMSGDITKLVLVPLVGGRHGLRN